MAAKKRARRSPQAFQPSFEGKEVGTMGMADEMRRLTEEILSAFDARVGRVATLRQETIEKLKGFRQAMKDLQQELRRKAADLKRFLSTAEASRMGDFQPMHQGIQDRQEERNGEVAAMRDGFHREQEAMHREMGAMAGQWRSLASTMARKRAGTAR